MAVLSGAIAALLSGSAAAGAKRERRRRRSVVPLQVTRFSPQTLLATMKKHREGNPRKPLPTQAESKLPNSGTAAQMLRERRALNRDKGMDMIRSSTLAKREARLPLIVKYHKPKGIMTSFKGKNNEETEDLRAVVCAAGDQWELDLYHPVGVLPMAATGLLLWSRSGILTKEMLNPRRGVVIDHEIEVIGAPNEAELREQLRVGAPLGIIGFQEHMFADLRSATLVPDSSLQEPRSILQIGSMGGGGKVKQLLKKIGFKVVRMKRTGHGFFSLGDTPVGEFSAATEEEEEWACQFATLPAADYPPGRLPPPTPEQADEELEEHEEELIGVTYSDRD